MTLLLVGNLLALALLGTMAFAADWTWAAKIAEFNAGPSAANSTSSGDIVLVQWDATPAPAAPVIASDPPEGWYNSGGFWRIIVLGQLLFALSAAVLMLVWMWHGLRALNWLGTQPAYTPTQAILIMFAPIFNLFVGPAVLIDLMCRSRLARTGRASRFMAAATAIPYTIAVLGFVIAMLIVSPIRNVTDDKNFTPLYSPGLLGEYYTWDSTYLIASSVGVVAALLGLWVIGYVCRNQSVATSARLTGR